MEENQTLSMKKVTICIATSSRPDFIPVQYESLKRFLKDDYEYVVLNNAINSKAMRKAITRTCDALGIRSIEIKKNKNFKIIGGQHAISFFGGYKNPNVATAYPIKYVWEDMCARNRERLLVIMDSDMFLCRPVSFNEELQGHDAAFITQYRGISADGHTASVTHPWNGICIFDVAKIPDLKTLNWDCGVIPKAFINGHAVDVGGYGHFWLKDHPVSIQHISEYAIHNFKLLPHNRISIEAVLNGNFHYLFTYDRTTKETSSLHVFRDGHWHEYTASVILPHFPRGFEKTVIKKTIRYFEQFVLNKQTYPAPTFLGIIEFESFTENGTPFIIHNKAGSGYMGFDYSYSERKLAFIEQTLGIDSRKMTALRKHLKINRFIDLFAPIKEYKRFIKIFMRKVKNITPKSLIVTGKNVVKKLVSFLPFQQHAGLDKKMIKKMIGHAIPVILEIGSAHGNDTAEFIHVFGDTGFRLYGFEPEPKNIRLIKEKIHDGRFHLFEGVVSDIDGNLTFNRSRTENPNDLSLSGSIMKPKNHLKLWDWIHFDETITVPSITLDTFVAQNKISVIDFIWCDVQGAEEKVIRGGAKTFPKNVRYFYTEYSNDEQYEGQPGRDRILQLLPDFEIVKDFGTDILLKNKHL
jgi:FkbM family methyltransferase